MAGVLAMLCNFTAMLRIMTPSILDLLKVKRGSHFHVVPLGPKVTGKRGQKGQQGNKSTKNTKKSSIFQNFKLFQLIHIARWLC